MCEHLQVTTVQHHSQHYNEHRVWWDSHVSGNIANMSKQMTAFLSWLTAIIQLQTKPKKFILKWETQNVNIKFMKKQNI